MRYSCRVSTGTPLTLVGRKRSPTCSQPSPWSRPCTTVPQTGGLVCKSRSSSCFPKRYARPAVWALRYLLSRTYSASPPSSSASSRLAAPSSASGVYSSASGTTGGRSSCPTILLKRPPDTVTPARKKAAPLTSSQPLRPTPNRWSGSLTSMACINSLPAWSLYFSGKVRSSSRIALTTSCSSSWWSPNGRRPQTSSKKITPSDQMSTSLL
mmetsp:Transcript_147298/g.410332  ORF Transcript_147298/g.410332 Transcript_147298/m.410332 type:complete len:211 (+) Transcript_147298:421-1053(+)